MPSQPLSFFHSTCTPKTKCARSFFCRCLQDPVCGLLEKLKAEPRVARVGPPISYQSCLLPLYQLPAFFPLPLKELHLCQRQDPEEVPPGAKGQLPTLNLPLRPALSPSPVAPPQPPPAPAPIFTRGLPHTSSGAFPCRILFLPLFFHL